MKRAHVQQVDDSQLEMIPSSSTLLSRVKWYSNSKETGHPIFTHTRTLSRWILNRRGRKITIHLFQTVRSVNQIGICAAVTDWCESLFLKVCYPFATEGCRLTHGINLEYGRTFLEIKISMFDSPRYLPQRISSDDVQRNREAALGDPKQKKQVWQVKTDKIMAQFQCRCLRQSRWLWILKVRLIFRRTAWSDSKDSKYRNCNSTFSLVHHHFFCRKQDSTQVSSGSDFPSDAMLRIKEVEMVDSLDEFKSSSVCGKEFPNFEMLDAKNASALNKIIQKSHFKKKVSLEEQKVPKKDRILRGRQIAFMIYDYFRVTDADDTFLDYAPVTLDNIQAFDTRWDEVLLSMTQIRPMSRILKFVPKTIF